MTTTLRVEVTRADTKMTVALAVMDCAGCGVIYAIGDEYNRRRIEDGKSFCCPNGHSQAYGGELDKLRTKAANAERQLAYANETNEGLARERDAAKVSLSATRGVVTRMKRRAMAGSCVYCHKPIPDLRLHMAEVHPEVTVDVDPA